MPGSVTDPAKISPLRDRFCNECQLCCELVEIPQLEKPMWSRCDHQCETGCDVWGTFDQPKVCREFRCGWLDGHFEDDARPDKTGIVCRMVYRQVKGTQEPIWAVFVKKWTDEAREQIDRLGPVEVTVIVHQKGRPRRVRLPYERDFEAIPDA